MAITVGEQTIAITAAALCGLSAGLLYDLLRPLRHAVSRFGAALCDVVFCLYCTAAMFLVAMLFCRGRAGVWEGLGFVAVFVLYIWGVSPSIAPIFGILVKKTAGFLKKAEKIVK